VKSNWGKLAPTAIYEHRVETVQLDGAEHTASVLLPIGTSDADGHALLSADREDTPASQRERAGELLADVLGDGAWRRAKEVKAAAKASSIPARTLERASHDVGVEKRCDGFPAVTFWRLPASAPRPPTHSLATAVGETGSPNPVARQENPDGAGDSEASATRPRQTHGNGETGTCGECGGLLASTPNGAVCFGCNTATPTPEQALRNGHGRTS